MNLNLIFVRYYLKIVVVLLLSIFAQKSFAGERLTNVDSFRNQFVENIEYCEKYTVNDTLKFLKDGYYSFVNYDNTSTFYKILFCFEDKFMNLTEPDHFKYPVEEFYRVRDIRWLFLFYIERYIFNMNSIRIDKFCKITLMNTKTKKEVEMWGGKSTENIITIYQKLLKSTVKKSFYKTVIKEKKMTPLEYIGYRFVVSKTKSAI
jgi:hypothetical protein